ncbi:multidrug efflux SMR transporter [Allobranchiibius sp. CTAmp26]|uniref:DMT family transporter n=1 Tax=Allobranchiibius sp. CTAmp26 TaxID=2815214 RepID=UPI001AA168EA|nr:SMR family transporter [Allobranchiibius sp. CTAmp26]MBO1756145.1 QacE family quaternary ammonium compound efflux SMR transporter [Allobranchiibius sp. CTAmp26]
MRLDSWPSGLLLTLAIALEVAGTLCLRASDGFTRPAPALGVLLGYGISLVFFARAITGGIGLGVAYGTLTGCGLAAAALLSALVFHEPLTLVQVLGLVVLAAGVFALIRRRPPVIP